MFASHNAKSGYGSTVLRQLAAVAALGAALFSGSAAAGENAVQSAVQQTRPADIYVYAFDSSASEVKLDTRMLPSMKTRLEGSSAADQQSADAAEVREEVANEIVQKLQSMGLHAVRADAPAPAGENVLMVTGHIDTIDAGNRRRRALVGLGAGKSEVGSSVQVLYKPAGGTPQLVQHFDASADSGKMPGVAETAGVGAAVGHVATSAALGGAMHGVSEAKRGAVSEDAKRLADSIAKQIAQAAAAEGMTPPNRING